MNSLKIATSLGLGDTLIRNAFQYKGKDLEKTVIGIQFKNPVGLGAGFDKNAAYLHELEALGFGRRKHRLETTYPACSDYLQIKH